MPDLKDLLKNLDTTKPASVEDIVKLINSNASELKAKILIDDGAENVYVPKARLDEEIGKKKTVQATLDTTNAELENIKKAVKGQDELVKQIETLQNGNKELDGKLKAQTLDTAIKLKAIELKAKDKSGADVLAFISKDKLKLNDDGTVTGLDEALKSLTDSKPYLFDTEPAGGTGNPGQSGKGGQGGKDAPSIGELLAKQNASNSGTGTDLQTARESFFK